MTVRFATQSEIDSWDSLIINNPDGGNIFQSVEFANIKKLQDWKIKYLFIDGIYSLIFERKIPILGVFWYAPKGPGIDSVDRLSKLLPDLKLFAKKHNVFTIKLEPEIIKTDEIINRLTSLQLGASKPIQASNTVILDISKPIDDIIAGFSPKTRANIRSAQKSNITTEIVPVSDANCKIFYKMMVATINGRSHIRSYEYMKKFWQTNYKAGTGIFIFAKSDNTILSTDFIMILGDKATRKDAASDRNHSVRGASAYLEKVAIEHLKTIGVTKYDLYGTPPSDQIKNQSHPYYGFGTFKAGFNSNITDYVGCFDLIIKPTSYFLWSNMIEKIAHKIYYYQHNDLYY